MKPLNLTNDAQCPLKDVSVLQNIHIFFLVQIVLRILFFVAADQHTSVIIIGHCVIFAITTCHIKIFIVCTHGTTSRYEQTKLIIGQKQTNKQVS